MAEITCILCGQSETVTRGQEHMSGIHCERCGRYEFHDDLLPFDKKDDIPDHHLISGYTRENTELGNFSEYNTLKSPDHCVQIAAFAPSSVPEKSRKFLEALERKTTEFGEEIQIFRERDPPLAYARSTRELLALIEYIKESGYVTCPNDAGPDNSLWLILTAKGMEALSSGSSKPLTVFISSTCYDLLDLRFELAAFLESQGHVVKMSEDPNRITVDPTVNSIKTCLQNVESSDVVICILDRRYGGILKEGDDKGKSATEVEIDHARKLKDPRKPIYIFVRDLAFEDYGKLCRNGKARTDWVEKGKGPKARGIWRDFCEKLTDLSTEQKAEREYSNWFNQFKSIVELKQLVQKHLTDFQHRPQSHLGKNK